MVHIHLWNSMVCIYIMRHVQKSKKVLVNVVTLAADLQFIMSFVTSVNSIYTN